jgi:NAD(P)-dependent dehydrogenase (short-subunit alcohol dehydrogenase family)
VTETLFSVEGKVAVVVGGGGVLAGEMAHGLAAYGASVVVVDINIDHAEARARAIRDGGGKSVAVQSDASSRPDLERALQETIAAFGGVDILINAAGINSGTPFFDITDEEWHRILDIDLKSIFLACQIFGKRMVEAGHGGSIINISSIASDPPLSKVFTYSVAKGGINQLTRFLAREWAPHRVRVNAILPGFVPAEQNRRLLTAERTAQALGHTPMGRFGEPHELVGAAIFLAAERASSYVTGALLRVDGGFGAMSI